MRKSGSVRLRTYSAFAAVAVGLGLVIGSTTLVALAAPFVVYLIVAMALVEPPVVDVRFRLEPERVVEGEPFEAAIEIESRSGAHELELLINLPAGIALLEGPARAVIHLPRGESRTLPLSLRAERWGAYRLGECVVRARDRFALVSFDMRVEAEQALRVYPRLERIERALAPFETQPRGGNQVARQRGEGIEFADVRPFAAGDQVRRINWRVSSRRQSLYLNQAHPERNSDVVIFLDSFAAASDESSGTLDLAVRLAASLADAYLQRRDRVGLVSFGGVAHWLLPSSGQTQLYRIVEALLATEVTLSFARKRIDVFPPRSLPPQALVVALTPLLDERGAAALLDLRTRGFDLVIVDVSPLPFAAEAADKTERLAQRLWPLWRQTLRFRYEQLGVTVVEATAETPLTQLIEEARRSRRSGRRLRA